MWRKIVESQKFWGLILTFGEVIWEKLLEGETLAPIPSIIGLNLGDDTDS